MDTSQLNQIKPSGTSVFTDIEKPRIQNTEFDLSHNKVLSGDMGYLYPVLVQECQPGDYWQIDTQVIVRFQPLVAPVLHEVNAYVHYYFVPYRLLNDDFIWEKWLVGPKDAMDPEPVPIKKWTPTAASKCAEGTLWDHLGFPPQPAVPPAGGRPLDFPRRAYNLIYNEYYRDVNLQDPLSLAINEDLMIRNNEKDYFTAALPWQARGIPVALDLSGIGQAIFNAAANVGGGDPVKINTGAQKLTTNLASSANIDTALGSNTVQFNNASFNLPDLRTMVTIQQWMEREALGGTRYVDYLQSMFRISPKDATLQRPEYIGGYKAPILFSDIPQTSESGVTPQGNLSGKGLSVGVQRSGAIKIEEYGLIMGLLSVIPATAYSQGINRQWLRDTRFDYYNPLFAGLSEQPILKREIYLTNSDVHNLDVFGYQGRFDELRYIPNSYAGKMRTTFDYWHLGRIFGSAPSLNNDFLKATPDKRIYKIEAEDGLIISVGFNIKADRPLPRLSMPGLEAM